MWVTSGDPFGIFRTSRKLADGANIVVYPKAVPLPAFGRVPGELPGGALQGARVQFSTPNVSSVRDYRPGDAFNRIHWPTTARTNRLMVREFELDPTADVWIVLDLNADAHTGTGLESTEEYAVNATASLAVHLLEPGPRRRPGVANRHVARRPGPRQAERILEVLALVRASSQLTLSAMLSAETSRFARSSTLIVVTPSTDEAWARFCQALNGRGVHSDRGLDRSRHLRPGALHAAASELVGGGAHHHVPGQARRPLWSKLCRRRAPRCGCAPVKRDSRRDRCCSAQACP